MNSKDIIKYLKNSIDEKGHYCYSLPIETTKAIIKHIGEKDKEIERLKNNIKELIELIDKEREHSNCLIDRNYKHLLKNLDQRTQIKHLQNLIDKTTNYYLKTLAKNKSMPDEATQMFNLLEENK